MYKYFLLICCLLSVVGCKSESARALREGNRLLNSSKEGDRDLAIDYFKKSIEREVKARNQLARAYYKIARTKMRKANRKLTEQAIRAHTDALIKKQLGVAEASLQLFNDAIKNFKAASAIIPNDKYIHYYLGLCYSQLSRSRKDAAEASLYINKALQEYRIALRLDSDFSIARYGLSMVYLNQKKYRLCLKELQLLIKQEHFKRIQAGKKVSSRFRKARIKSNPKEIRAYFALARVYYEMKLYRKAESVYRIILELLPARSFKRKLIRRNIQKLEVMRK